MKKLFLFLAIVLIASFVISCNANEAIYLTAGEKGEYGKSLTYNKGTEFEETFYAYYIPAGTYTATNRGKYMTQVNVYSDQTQIVEGWEEPVDCKVYLLNVDQSKEIVVPEGYHIEIGEPTQISLKIKN